MRLLWMGLRISVATLLFCSGAQCTTLVAIRDGDKDRIVIATDSLVRGRYTPAELQCKIHVVAKDCAFAASGLYESQKPVFRISSYARSACKSGGDLMQRADSFLAEVFPRITEVVKFMRDTEPRYLQEHYEGKPVFEVLFIGTYNQHPAVFLRGIAFQHGVLSKEAGEVTYDDQAIFSGANTAILDYVARHPDWKQLGSIEAAQYLIKLEVGARPNIVGLPISVVTVDGTGSIRWVQKGKCDGTKQAP